MVQCASFSSRNIQLFVFITGDGLNAVKFRVTQNLIVSVTVVNC